MKYLISCLALSLSACSLTPKLHKPEAPVPAACPMASATQESRQAEDVGWRSMFPGARLQGLIALALENNSQNRGLSFTPQIVQPLFLGGRLRADLRREAFGSAVGLYKALGGGLAE